MDLANEECKSIVWARRPSEGTYLSLSGKCIVVLKGTEDVLVKAVFVFQSSIPLDKATCRSRRGKVAPLRHGKGAIHCSSIVAGSTVPSKVCYFVC